MSLSKLDLTGADGWLRVESSALCRTDLLLHTGALALPAVLGHHVVGVIDEVTDDLAAALGVGVGARVVVEEYLGCGVCGDCEAGQYRFCAQADLWAGGERVGMLPVERGSGLHGGNAEYLELTPKHVLHPVPKSLPVNLAAWILPLANAWEWTVHVGGAQPGKRVGVIGPGYHGLACVAAARAAGVEDITVLGQESDRARLGLAERLGAHTEVADCAAVERVRRRTGGLDVVVDTAGTSDSWDIAIQLAARFGTVVVSGIKAGQKLAVGDRLVRDLLRVCGVRGRSPYAVRHSIELLAGGVCDLELIPTFYIGLDEVGGILHDIEHGGGPASPHIVVLPGHTPLSATWKNTSQEIFS